MHDATKFARIIVPSCFWLTSETLNSTKRGILCHRSQMREECQQHVMPYLDDDCMRMLANRDDRDYHNGGNEL